MKKIFFGLLLSAFFIALPASKAAAQTGTCPTNTNVSCSIDAPKSDCFSVGACDDVNTKWCCPIPGKPVVTPTPVPTAQPGSCPGTCVDTAFCGGVISGYYGSCGPGRECCKTSLFGAGNPTKSSGSGILECPGGKTGINTAIGCVPFGDSTNSTDLVGFLLRWAIGVGGGIAFLLILYAGFQIMTSQGDPQRLKAGQELLTAAISGLIMLIFSIFILRVIGVDILKIF